jgi:pimeloyl-ACP methyl ester carboxylesterase
MAAHHVHPIPRAGHWVHYDQPELFLNAVQKILEGSTPP